MISVRRQSPLVVMYLTFRFLPEQNYLHVRHSSHYSAYRPWLYYLPFQPRNHFVYGSSAKHLLAVPFELIEMRSFLNLDVTYDPIPIIGILPLVPSFKFVQGHRNTFL